MLVSVQNMEAWRVFQSDSNHTSEVSQVPQRQFRLGTCTFPVASDGPLWTHVSMQAQQNQTSTRYITRTGCTVVATFAWDTLCVVCCDWGFPLTLCTESCSLFWEASIMECSMRMLSACHMKHIQHEWLCPNHIWHVFTACIMPANYPCEADLTDWMQHVHRACHMVAKPPNWRAWWEAINCLSLHWLP